MRLLFVLVALGLLSGCDRAPARVTFDREHCLLDGRLVVIEEVEAEQARLSQRVLDRQPWQTAITLAILLGAVATNLGKIGSMLGLGGAKAEGTETRTHRIRAALDRQQHPLRYFAVIVFSLLLLGAAGGFYLYLDVDKRASERALQQLQFCHLTLKSAAEQVSLDEQRKNLDALQSTAGSIKQLVDTLPPEEQRKAELLLGQMRSALGNQQHLIAKQNAVATAVQAGSALIQRNLGALEADVVGLKPVPARLRELSDELGRIDARTKLGEKGPANLGDAFGEVRKEVAAVSDRVGQVDCARAKLATGKTVGETLAELAARPPQLCKCECGGGAISGRDGGAK